MKLPPYSSFAKYWGLDPEIVFLNHGSFGATPTSILQKQQQLRERMESEPVRFQVRELYGLYQASLEKLASLAGTKSSNLVFIKNTTMGVNTIFHSLQFREGDELLTHSHAYGACMNAMKWYAERQKLKINVADIPFPIKNPDEVVEAFLKSVTPKTKLALVDHITSATGLVFPVEKITKELQARGIEVLIDGAHAPGLVHLDLDKLNAEYYVGNCHKWICSPKGSAMMFVRQDKQQLIEPLQLSHAFDAPVAEEKKWQGKFFWPGTDDYTAYCCVKEAIEFNENLFPGGWNELREKNRSLTLKARKHIADKIGTPLPAPDEMIANLANIFISETQLPPYGFNYISPLQEKLFSGYKIEVPVFTFNRSQPRHWVRIAVQVYNSAEQYEYLAHSIVEIISQKKLAAHQ